MRLQKIITFRKADKEVLDYLNTIDNASGYVINLIKEDLDGKEKRENFDVTIVLSELKEIKELLLRGKSGVNVTKVKELDQEEVQAVLNLLGEDWGDN